MTVRADQQVSGRIGIEVEHGESKIAAMDDQPFPIFARLHRTERAVLLIRAGRLVLPLDVDHPVRGPQPLKSVGGAWMGGRVLQLAHCPTSSRSVRTETGELNQILTSR